MKSRLNVRAVVAFAFCFLGGIAVLLILGYKPFNVFASMVFLAFVVLIGFSIDLLGLGKFFGGKS